MIEPDRPLHEPDRPLGEPDRPLREPDRPPGEPDRPLRRDAERNRQRILDAARELFAERGLGVTLNDVAHHAGVGVGTVYRRFPDKASLIDELFEQRVEDLVLLMERAVANADPWHGLREFLEQSLELQARDCALKELIIGMPDGLRRIGLIRARLKPLGDELVRRCHESGQLRPDIAAEDLPIVHILLSAVIDAAHDVEPELWRRYLGIVVRGLAAAPDSVVLAPGPLPADTVDHVMSRVRTARHDGQD